MKGILNSSLQQGTKKEPLVRWGRQKSLSSTLGVVRRGAGGMANFLNINSNSRCKTSQNHSPVHRQLLKVKGVRWVGGGFLCKNVRYRPRTARACGPQNAIVCACKDGRGRLSRGWAGVREGKPRGSVCEKKREKSWPLIQIGSELRA